jgi:two-component system, sensor histidine kinase and response regulator
VANNGAAALAASECSFGVSEGLASIDGLDPVQGLRSFRGHMAPYQRLLGQFASQHEQDMSLLLDCLDRADIAEARRLAHSLKGSAAALGALRIQQHAAQLEAALREILEEKQEDEATRLARLRPLAKTLADELAAFAAAVARALATPTTPIIVSTPAGQAPIDWPTLRAALERLEALLAEDDMQASEVLAGSALMLRAALGGQAEPMIRAIEIFDFPAALITLRNIRAAHAELAGAG